MMKKLCFKIFKVLPVWLRWSIAYILNNRFIVGISALVVKNGKILLLRSSYQYYWTLPGGYLKVGEDINESIQREIKEELGLKVTVDRFLKVRVVPKKPVIDILVLCKIVDGEIKVDGKEIKEAGFFDIDHMPTKDNMPSYQLEYINLLKDTTN